MLRVGSIRLDAVTERRDTVQPTGLYVIYHQLIALRSENNLRTAQPLRAKHLVHVAQRDGRLPEHVMGEDVTCRIGLADAPALGIIRLSAANVVGEIETGPQDLLLLLRRLLLAVRVRVHNKVIGLVRFPPAILPVREGVKKQSY